MPTSPSSGPGSLLSMRPSKVTPPPVFSLGQSPVSPGFRDMIVSSGQHYFLGLSLGVNEPPLIVPGTQKLRRESLSGSLVSDSPSHQDLAPRSLFAATEKERLAILNSLTKTHTPSGKFESPLRHSVFAPDVVSFDFIGQKRSCEVPVKVLVQNASVHRTIEFSVEFLPPTDPPPPVQSPTSQTAQSPQQAPPPPRRFVFHPTHLLRPF